MKTQRFVIGLTLLNLILVMPALFRANSAPPEPVVPMLRAHGLEIVDDHGQVRAMIKIFPADPNVKMPDGTTGYPETVLLRLINSKGAPAEVVAVPAQLLEREREHFPVGLGLGQARRVFVLFFGHRF